MANQDDERCSVVGAAGLLFSIPLKGISGECSLVSTSGGTDITVGNKNSLASEAVSLGGKA